MDSNSYKVPHEWLATLLENNRTNNRNNVPSPQNNSICYLTLDDQKNYKLMRAASLLPVL